MARKEDMGLVTAQDWFGQRASNMAWTLKPRAEALRSEIERQEAIEQLQAATFNARPRPKKHLEAVVKATHCYHVAHYARAILAGKPVKIPVKYRRIIGEPVKRAVYVTIAPEGDTPVSWTQACALLVPDGFGLLFEVDTIFDETAASAFSDGFVEPDVAAQ